MNTDFDSRTFSMRAKRLLGRTTLFALQISLDLMERFSFNIEAVSIIYGWTVGETDPQIL